MALAPPGTAEGSGASREFLKELWRRGLGPPQSSMGSAATGTTPKRDHPEKGPLQKGTISKRDNQHRSPGTSAIPMPYWDPRCHPASLGCATKAGSEPSPKLHRSSSQVCSRVGPPQNGVTPKRGHPKKESPQEGVTPIRGHPNNGSPQEGVTPRRGHPQSGSPAQPPGAVPGPTAAPFQARMCWH